MAAESSGPARHLWTATTHIQLAAAAHPLLTTLLQLCAAPRFNLFSMTGGRREGRRHIKTVFLLSIYDQTKRTR